MWVKHKKLILASLGSVLIHVLLLVIFALLLALQPPAPADRPTQPIRLQIVQPEQPPALTAKAVPTPRKKMINTDDLQEAQRPPDDAQAEADKNTAARSELAPTGADARPSQNGKVRPIFSFDTHQFVAADSSQPQPGSTPVVETAPPLPQPDSQAARPLATPPTAAPTPAATPVPTPAPDEFAMLDPTPTPKPPDFDPFVRDPVTEPPKPTPVAAPAAAKPPSSLTSEEKTQIRGDISNRGASSVAAVATPQGRYTKAISDAIYRRWYARVNSQMDLVSLGTVKIHFSLDRRGKVIAPRIISNSGNEVLASISMAAIMDGSLPPVPPEVAAAVNSVDIPLDFDFSLY
jgi:outer membrane biosynthesis protein TonB